MTPEPRDPKKLPEYLELDYFRRPSRFRRLWRVLPVAALVLAVAAVAAWAFLPGQSVVYQAGPVSPPHSLFNQDCGKCHTLNFPVLNRFASHDDAVRSVPDNACLQCHDGARHQPNLVHEVHCAVCHREHRGREALARVGDDQCLVCHRDLHKGIAPGQEPRFASFASWAGHPELGLRWEGAPKDPGTVKFNHQAHLDPRGIPVLDREQVENQLADPSFARRGADVQTKVLKCNDCHQQDAAGRYMQPVRYEQHCAPCHPLGVQVVSDLETAKAREALQKFSRVPAPHREPLVVRSVLRQRLTDFIREEGNAMFKFPPRESEDALPRHIGPRPRPELLGENEWVLRQLEKMEDGLFRRGGGCVYCHEPKEPGKAEYLESRINKRSFPLLGGESERWFPHSRFNHERHRMLDCGECHDAKYSRLTSDVLMPGIASCRLCHDNRPAASARSDCVECHSYHHAERGTTFQGMLKVEEVTGKPWDAAKQATHPGLVNPGGK